jgi:hypothetical protein
MFDISIREMVNAHVFGILSLINFHTPTQFCYDNFSYPLSHALLLLTFWLVADLLLLPFHLSMSIFL